MTAAMTSEVAEPKPRSVFCFHPVFSRRSSGRPNPNRLATRKRRGRERILALNLACPLTSAICTQGNGIHTTASALDVPAGTVKSRLHLALTELRDRLEPTATQPASPLPSERRGTRR